VPLNFLNPIPGTPLQGLPLLSPLEALAAVAVFRLYNPRAHLRACGGRHQVLGRLAPLMYLAGASATMTGNYLTTEGQRPDEDAADVAALGLCLASLQEKTA
jgi:biotin synthase